MLTLFPSGLSDLGCCHIPEAWAGLGPLDGLSWDWGRWGGYASQWAMPHRCGVPVPLCTHPQSPDPSRSSCSETTPPAPKGCGASALEELWKAPWVPCLLMVRFPPPASFLSVAAPVDESTFHRVVLQELGCVQETGVRKEGRRNGTQALGVSSGTFHSNWQSRNRTFPKALVPPVTRVGVQRCAATLKPFPTTITETFAHGHLIVTRPVGYK